MTSENLKKQLVSEFEQLTNAHPEYDYCPEYDPIGYEGVKAIWINGPKYEDKPTKIFAYVGFPEMKDGEKVPGIVLMHGGCGHAYPNWVKMWNDRGYAAIAPDNTGFWPKNEGITDFYAQESWTRELPSSFCGKFSSAPDNDGMYKSTLSLNDQWMFHAVSQCIICNNILRSLDFVDNEKIGITGISWGGVITSIALGFDSRFRFAIPVYGSAYLSEGLTWIKDNFNSEGTKALWEPANRIDRLKMNILWLFWTNDVAFSPNSASKSYLSTRNNSVLSLKMDMLHGHVQGWAPPEIMRFADSIVKGGEKLLEIITDPVTAKGKVSCEFKLPDDAKDVSARLCYVTEKISYSTNGIQSRENPDAYGKTETIEQAWQTAECDISDTACTATVPTSAHTFYVEFKLTTNDGAEYITTSELISVKE